MKAMIGDDECRIEGGGSRETQFNLSVASGVRPGLCKATKNIKMEWNGMRQNDINSRSSNFTTPSTWVSSAVGSSKTILVMNRAQSNEGMT